MFELILKYWRLCTSWYIWAWFERLLRSPMKCETSRVFFFFLSLSGEKFESQATWANLSICSPCNLMLSKEKQLRHKRDVICDIPYIRAACWQIYPQSIWCKLATLNLDVTGYLSYQWTVRLAEEHDWPGSASASLGLSVPLADWSMCDPTGSKGQDLNENFK